MSTPTAHRVGDTGGSRSAVAGVWESITCGVDGQRHDVSAEQWARGLASGQYLAGCGRLVFAASLLTPPGPRCLSCEAARLAESPVAPSAADGDQRRAWRRRNRWLVSRCQQSQRGRWPR